MDGVMLLQRVVDETTRVVDQLTDDQMVQPSPCEGWTVRDVVNHITGGSTMFALSVEQGSVPDDVMGQLMGGDNLGDDAKGAWHAASAKAMRAFAEPGVLEKAVTLPFGDMPASAALSIAVFDVLTHAVDIASPRTSSAGRLRSRAARCRRCVADDASPGLRRSPRLTNRQRNWPEELARGMVIRRDRMCLPTAG